MKVLMLSTDRDIFKAGSDARNRMIDYGSLVDELHIIVLARRDLELKPGKLSENVWVYPTNSTNKWFYITNVYAIAQQIVKKWENSSRCLITTQDPFELGFVGWQISSKYKIPLQLQVHTDFMSSYFQNESVLNRIRVMIANFLIPRARGVRVVSERIKKSLKRDAVVLPVFVDTVSIKNAEIKTDLHEKYSGYDFIVFMASRFSKEKNIELAISAMKDVVKKNPRSLLLIAGDGPQKEQYENEIKKFGLGNNVQIEGRTNDLTSYYKTADIFLLTSNYEGYGRTVVEAQAAGLPVVMTDVGVAGDVIKDRENGLVIPVGDRNALTEAILSVKEERLQFDFTKPVYQITREEYLKEYKKSWEGCL